MLLLCLFIIFYSLCETTGYGIKSDNNTIELMEDENTTLSCTYEGSVDSLHWYQQKPGSRSEFLIMIDEASEYVSKANPPHPRLSIKLQKAQKRVYLEISSAAVMDSAVYYCALRTTGGGYKIIFGSGTSLIIDTKVQKSPEYYKLDDSCLATDFTNHSYVKSSGAGPVRYSGKEHQNFYSSFILGGAQDCPETGDCKEGSSGQSSEIEKDEKINFLSLGLFWLRILFVKTVAFNLLMTFKAWMS